MTTSHLLVLQPRHVEDVKNREENPGRNADGVDEGGDDPHDNEASGDVDPALLPPDGAEHRGEEDEEQRRHEAARDREAL